MSLHTFKPYSRALLLVAAALVAATGAAVAADSAGDAQQQIGQLLAGRIVTQSAPASARHDDWTARRSSDLHELARRILGATESRAHGTALIRGPENASVAGDAKLKKDLPVHGDAQAIAQRLLLGQRNAGS